MVKNIVICLDGTGNQIEKNLSNVLKLYRTLEKNEKQLVFYDQGVGTLGRIYTWGWLRQRLNNFLGLAFGLGLDKNVLKAYEFIVTHFEEHKVKGKDRPVGDNIYVFGFSRGAHTARVLAALIYEVGVLKPDQIHLSGAALTAYKQSGAKNRIEQDSVSSETYEGNGANFRRVAATRTAAIKFLGVWDTVSSVFIPNAGKLWPPIKREKLPHTWVNPAVQTFRQAASIDERRRMFRLDPWVPGQDFKPRKHSTGTPEKQNARQVWFAGCHSDVGGGYDRLDSGASQFPIIWMIKEAEKSGLKVFKRMADYVTGVEPWSSTTKYIYPRPDFKASLHNSLTLPWMPFEIIPKSIKRREWKKRPGFLGFYLPLAEPRFIPDDAHIHQSVLDRMKACPDYQPVNIPKKYLG